MSRWNLFNIFKYILMCFFSGFVAIQIGFIIQIALMIKFNPSTTSFMTNEYNRLCFLKQACNFQHKWVDYNNIGRQIKKAVISSEDANFTDHNGIEVDSILTAWEKNKNKGKIIAGGSTISQQLAKNLFLSSEKNYARKLQELLLTFYLENILEKQRILEIYLNSVEWGKGIFGIYAASTYYFNKKPDNLSAYQAASLAAALPAPKCFHDELYCSKSRINFKKHANKIAKRMGIADIPDNTDNIKNYIKKYSSKSKNDKN